MPANHGLVVTGLWRGWMITSFGREELQFSGPDLATHGTTQPDYSGVPENPRSAIGRDFRKSEKYFRNYFAMPAEFACGGLPNRQNEDRPKEYQDPFQCRLR